MKFLGHGPLVKGQYLHWDELRHREPPEDLTLDEWWLVIKFSRLSSSESTPLVDDKGHPFALSYVASVREKLHEIDQSFGMAGPSSDVKDMVGAHGRSYLLTNSLIEEAIRSSQLEGASTTRARAKEMIREGRKPKDRSERMILNNFRAMERIEELSNAPLDKDTVLELHRILVDGTFDDPAKAGAFRTAEDHVVVELLHTVKTAHVPPPAHQLERRMGQLLAFANGDVPVDWLHPVLRAVILHFMIGYDHPFVDGNGRVARALFYWAMLRYGYPLTKYLSISKILRNAPAKYSRAYLHTETDGGDLTYFVGHQLGVISRSITALEDYVAGKVEATNKMEAQLKDIPGLNHRQIRLLGHALRNPGFQYTVASHEKSHRVVNTTARTDLKGLGDQGLLIQTKQGRRLIFVAPRELDERLRFLQADSSELPREG